MQVGGKFFHILITHLHVLRGQPQLSDQQVYHIVALAARIGQRVIGLCQFRMVKQEPLSIWDQRLVAEFAMIDKRRKK